MIGFGVDCSPLRQNSLTPEIAQKQFHLVQPSQSCRDQISKSLPLLSSSSLNGYHEANSLYKVKNKAYPDSENGERREFRCEDAIFGRILLEFWSRICVKNLPNYISEDRLREFFSQKGEVTDAKLLRTKDGKSRQFGFIGYRTEQEAKEALKYFNSSYLDTSRINCEIAHKVGDPNIPRPWSRYSLKQEENLTEVKKVCPKNGAPASSKGEKKSGKKASGNDDPQLQEFLQVMQPRVKSKLWANDSLTSPIHEQTEKAGYKNTPTKVVGEEKSKHRSLGSQAAEKSSNLAHDEVISDMDYFKSRVKKKWSDSESSDEEDYNDNNGEDAGGNHSMKKSSEHQDGQKVNPEGDPPVSLKDDKNELLETGRVFVRNLPYSATEDELEEHFSKFGNVSQVHLVVDKDTKQSKGIAYVVYTLPESAARFARWDYVPWETLTVCQGIEYEAPKLLATSNAYANESSKTFKQRRENERKASEASGNTQAWNSLFMRPDTVVENIARKFGVSKSDLLEREADDLAVRIALGETQVIAETKKALVNAGVNLDSLEEFAKGKADGMKRSNHVILVKNLPYGSSEGELAKMFGKFGSLDKIILPPTKTLALYPVTPTVFILTFQAVFIEPAEARKAFRGLAYKRYK
ncbi:nucleotide/nucleic acid binding protein [Actinidia rufa]|uniref:Nucleotide/nucleic acid binding protein n=1 Tax=Actinidia rufa TaxID=165716 RepID=A0A7J0GBZ8_9ERIC|nr:nucleotide/nucleic acid binding protein [Actinidia rufa]